MAIYFYDFHPQVLIPRVIRQQIHLEYISFGLINTQKCKQ